MDTPAVRFRCGMMTVAIAAFALGGSTGCDLLDVAQPGVIPERDLNNPGRAPFLVQSAIADFECAFAQYVLATGQLTDELYGSTNAGVPLAWDRRFIFPTGSWGTVGCVPDAQFAIGVYTPLSTARFDADDAFRRIATFDSAAILGRDTKPTLLALAAAYAGYSYTLFGEGFCEAAFDVGPVLPPQQVLAIAEQRFDTALYYAARANKDSIVNMAYAGRARVRLLLGNLAGAVADARLIPSGFVKYATYSSANVRRNNRVYAYNRQLGYVSVDPRFRNLTVGGVVDPRVQAVYAGRNGNDGRTPLWYQTRYTSVSSPIAIASWAEAQLIIAEAEGGQSAVDRINALRSRFPGLPLFASSDSATIMQQVYVERQRELYLDGHRLGDILRLNIPFDGQPPNPLLDHLGRPYGTATCLPLPDVETRR